MTIECCSTIYGIRLWFVDDDGYSIKFQFLYRNNEYYIKSHIPIDFTIFNFGDEGE